MSYKVQRISVQDIVHSLRSVGVERGDVVHVQSSLPHLGPVDSGDTPDQILDTYRKAFDEVIGDHGTLLVHTPFEDYARYGIPFTVELSPSRAGVFSEYVRTIPGAIRSTHPVVSTAGIGPKAAEICGGSHFEGFGYQSSWGRMHRSNVLMVTLGLEFRAGLSFAHYIESLYGVPYQYCKVFSTPVESNGHVVDGTFTMRVRYLDYSIAIDLSRYQRELIRRGVGRTASCGRHLVQAVRAQDAFDVGVEMLENDVFSFLLSAPTFRSGEIPADGPTGHPGYLFDTKDGIVKTRGAKQPARPKNSSFAALRQGINDSL